jgi:hypothetical protein
LIPGHCVNVIPCGFAHSDRNPNIRCRDERKTERWRELCEQAAVEQDPQRMLKLISEINDLLLGKQRRLERPDDSEQSKVPPKVD